MSQMKNIWKEEQRRGKVAVIPLKLFLKTLSPYNPSDSLLKAAMPQKWSRKIDACFADNASFLTVWVSGAKKGWCMTLSLFFLFPPLNSDASVFITYKQKSLLSQKLISLWSFTIFWKGDLLVQLLLLQCQHSSQSWCIYPHRTFWRRDNALIEHRG